MGLLISLGKHFVLCFYPAFFCKGCNLLLFCITFAGYENLSYYDIAAFCVIILCAG